MGVKECSEDKAQAINEIAAKQLSMLFADLQEVEEDKELLKQYEVDFLGDLYARMVVAATLGFRPDLMGVDAIEATERLLKLSEGEESE